MRSHPEFEAAFRTGLAAQEMPAGLRAVGDLDRRFAVYRNNVAHSLLQALRQRFPVVERIVGADFFAATARIFVERHPPETPVLLHYGGAMPSFLEGFPPASSLPYVADVARLELARGAAYHADDSAPVDPARLAALAQRDPEDLVIGLHPSLHVVTSSHPVLTIWHANQPGGDPASVRWQPEAVLAFRRGEDVTMRALSPAAAGFIEDLQYGHPLGPAVTRAGVTDPRFDVQTTLAGLLQDGLVGAAQAPRPPQPSIAAIARSPR